MLHFVSTEELCNSAVLDVSDTNKYCWSG